MSCVTARFIEGVGLDLGEVMGLHLILPINGVISITGEFLLAVKSFDKCRVHVIKDGRITKLVVISGNEYGKVYTLETIYLLQDIKSIIKNHKKTVGKVMFIEYDGTNVTEFSHNHPLENPDIELWTDYEVMEGIRKFKTSGTDTA